jgi:hypothetical protein
MIIPKEYGGLGFSAFGHAEIVRKIATRSASAAVTAMVPNSLGPGELIMKFGTQAQRDEWLPRLADGREVPAFGLTSPEAGSDAGAMIDDGRGLSRDLEGPGGAGHPAELAQALHHPGPGLHGAGPGLQAARPRPPAGRRGRHRHHLRPGPDRHRRGRDRPPPPARLPDVPERSQLGQGRLHPDGPGDRRRRARGPGLDDADDRPGGRARHLAAGHVGRGGGVQRPDHRGLCPRPQPVQRADRQVRGRAGAPGPHRRQRLPAGRRAVA